MSTTRILVLFFLLWANLGPLLATGVENEVTQTVALANGTLDGSPVFDDQNEEPGDLARKHGKGCRPKCDGGDTCVRSCRHKCVKKLTAYADTDYCNLESCSKKPHVMCDPSKVTPDWCTDTFQAGTFTHQERTAIIDGHDSKRQLVAEGTVTNERGETFPSANADGMKKLSWNAELAKLAARNVVICDMEHDKCRNTALYKVGQNLHWSANSKQMSASQLIDAAINGWYKEYEITPLSEIHNFQNLYVTVNGKQKAIGHFTQLVWGNTYDIGCAWATYKNNGMNNYLMACNYGPAGNFKGQPVYPY